MRLSRPVLVAVLSWLAVVAVGSTLVWAVISRAGDGLTTASDGPGGSGGTTQSSGTIPGATFTAVPTPVSPTGSGSPSSPLSPSSSSSLPPSQSSSSSSPSSSSEPPSSAPPATDPPSSAAPPVRERAVWQGVGGTVVAECAGSAISLVSASPDAGFRAEVGNPGPQELEVEFEGREDESGKHAKVRAECVGGTPRFTSEVESEGAED